MKPTYLIGLGTGQASCNGATAGRQGGGKRRPTVRQQRLQIAVLVKEDPSEWTGWISLQSKGL